MSHADPNQAEKKAEEGLVLPEQKPPPLPRGENPKGVKGLKQAQSKEAIAAKRKKKAEKMNKKGVRTTQLKK